MSVMARKKPDSKRSQGVDRHVSPRLAFHLDQSLLAALEQHIESLSPRPSMKATLVAAIEEYLRARGCWPTTTKEG
jgi:hypothetical protein